MGGHHRAGRHRLRLVISGCLFPRVREGCSVSRLHFYLKRGEVLLVTSSTTTTENHNKKLQSIHMYFVFTIITIFFFCPFFFFILIYYFISEFILVGYRVWRGGLVHL